MKKKADPNLNNDHTLEETNPLDKDLFSIDNDPEWNDGVAEFSQTYAQYSFEGKEINKDKNSNNSSANTESDIHEIWY
ncbi:MAG: hypothetical protein H6Q14_259 [Bacteroidetes bacterium]|jgi:hypothetical protein|nr:hypothetical protein [Bacteroidota bacterium]